MISYPLLTAWQTSVLGGDGATTYAIGGTVTGLSGSGLVVQDNGLINLVIRANGSFNFATEITSGGTYSVTVLSQPSSPRAGLNGEHREGTARIIER